MTSLTAQQTPLVGTSPCPWWCTAAPDDHAWSADSDGRIGRLHYRPVGGFTVSATEWTQPDGTSTIELRPTRVELDMFYTSTEAAALSEHLHLIAAILRRIEAGPDPEIQLFRSLP